MSFDKNETEFGDSELKRMGIKDDYVCFCIRDAVYRDKKVKQRTNISELTNKYRNSSPENYKKGIESLAGKGYQAVRIGACVESPLDWKGVVDYAYHYRSEFLDLYLLKKTSFFVCNPSGIQAVAQLFSKPLLSINYT